MRGMGGLRRIAKDEVRRDVDERLRGAGLSRIEEVRAEDVVIVRYPKSGSTWFGAMIAGAVFGLDLNRIPARVLTQVVPGMHDVEHYRRFRTPMFFKSHLLPRPEYRRVVYVIRDGRDVMVSYLHHLRRTGLVDESVDLVQLLRSPDLLFPSTWQEHVEAWKSNPHGAEMMTIRYEDLLADPVPELRRVCAFAGLERDPALLVAVVEQASFERMQVKERKAKEVAGQRLPAERLFFRRGQAGSYRDEMTAEALEAFMDQAGPTLRRFGYPTTESGLETAGTR